jgi:gliding motility-associated lipoprotein GldD
MKLFSTLLVLLTCLSCEEVLVPKPKAFFSLDYKKASYHESYGELPFLFEKNKLTQLSISKKQNNLEGIILRYPTLKASVFINYKKVNNNLKKHIIDAKKMTAKHRQMANEISQRKYDNNFKKVYGMFYDLKGNVASQSQFYVTDSVNHFLSGALYFEAKPNYDSTLPAISYIQKDIMRFIESLRWK